MKLIIFDLDGTLLDTGKGILKCIASTLKKMGFQVPSEEVCKTFIGPPLKKRFLEVFESDEKTADTFVAMFREEYPKGDLFFVDQYEGMMECLNELHKNYTLAVATNKREDFAVALLEKCGMAQFFDAICGSDMASKLTKAQIVASAADRLSVPYADCVMVGDSSNDAVAAAQLGMPFVGVTYGYGFKTNDDVGLLLNASCADSPLQLKEIVGKTCFNH